MGASIFSEIVSEGLLEAGDTSLTARMTFRLKKWLRSQAEGFMWPQCKSSDTLDLVAGTEAFSIGGGLGGVTPEISRINDPMKIWSGSGATLQDHANIRIHTDWDDALINPFTAVGKPTQARVSQILATKGAWDVALNHETDRAYTVQLSFYIIPVDPATSAVPWYPNDQTMVQFVYATALRYKKDHKEAAEQFTALAAMVSRDKMAEGQKPGVTDGGIQLSRKYFR